MESNIESLIAEVRSDLSKYSDAGLIDDNSIYRDIVLGLKKFGNDLTELQETVVDVKEGYGSLPESFFSLYAAYLCEPAYYKCTDIEYHDLQQSYFYRERVESSSKWNECEGCCEVKEEKVIKENLYFKRGKAEFYYQNPTLLTLGKTFKKSACHSNCRNKLAKDNPNEIVIYGTTLQTNFPEGSVYMQYYGLPMDENGKIDIPETKNGFLETYLEYHVKRRLAERLLGNNDATGLSQLYSIYAQQEQIALKNASGNIKMSRINPLQTRVRIQRLNRLETLSYEVRV
jgi:hypothetical protein